MYKPIDIDNLLLDENNPRLTDISDQDDALEKIIIDQGAKLVNLARDIISMGSTNPSELPIVIPSSDEKDKYIVLEGNRRLAVLRLLCNNNLIAGIEDAALKTEFQKLSLEFHKNPISKLQCYVAKNRIDADHWRMLRHTGSNNGVGTVTWNASAVARFSKQLGVTKYSSLALQVKDHLIQDTSFSKSLKNKLETDVKLTNLGRLINDPAVRDYVGLKVDDGELDTASLNKEVMHNLELLIGGISADNFQVRQIYNKEDRKAYIESLDLIPVKRDTGTAGANGKTGKSTARNGQKDKAKKSNPLSTNRKTLIPSGTIMKIAHSRLNKIYHELRGLEVEHYENCVAVLLRVFLELSIDEYASTRKIPAYSEKSKLANKIKATADYLVAQGFADDKKLKAIRVEAFNPYSLFSTDTLHAYVHNKDLEPKARELKITWNNIESFIMALWKPTN
jgi:hypothetical protein